LKFAEVLLLNTLLDPKRGKFTVKVTFQCQDIYQVFSPSSSYGSQFKSLKAGRRWHTYFTFL